MMTYDELKQKDRKAERQNDGTTERQKGRKTERQRERKTKMPKIDTLDALGDEMTSILNTL